MASSCTSSCVPLYDPPLLPSSPSSTFNGVTGVTPTSVPTQSTVLPTKRTLRPIVTGTSIVALTYDDGIMLACDTLGSYGSLARYRSLSRVHKVNDTTIVAASGDYADFQHIERLLDRLNIKSDSLCDGYTYTPRSTYAWLTNLLYNRRTKINPLWNTVIVGGYHERTPFLGYVNLLGVAFEAPTLATGFGSYIAQPLLRDAYEKNPNMNKDEAKELLERCLRVLYYRDARSLNKYEIATVTCDGVTISEPMSASTDWSVANYVKGYD